MKDYNNLIKEISIKVIKEFAERAKQKSRFMITLSSESKNAVLISDIDELVETIEKEVLNNDYINTKS